MPKQIKEAKNIEILVNITYEEKENSLLQKYTFVVSNKKYLKYLQDARFSFKFKLEKIINELLLQNFQRREDSEECIIMYYDKQKMPPPIIRKIQGYVPPYTGCQYCRLAEFKEQFVYCTKKEKHYVGGVKRCPVFRNKDELIT